MNEAEGSSGLSLDQITRIVVAGRWLILGSLVLCTVITGVVLDLMPNRYESEAILMVVQQQVSQKYVDPANTMSTLDAVNALTRAILSRNRLLEVIDATGLYRSDRSTLTPAVLVDRMRKDVTVEPVDQIPGGTDYQSIRIAFSATNPVLARDVAGRLTNLFIEENVRSRGSQATTTTKFLTEQLEQAKKRLEQQEQKLREFKASNLGELPEQEQVNLGALTDLRIQLQNTMSSISRVEQQRIGMQSQLNGNLARLQSERDAMLANFRPKHPEVVAKDRLIERYQALLGRLTGVAGLELSQTLASIDDPVLVQMKGQIEAGLAEMANLNREQQRLRSEILQYQNRLKLTPVREQQLTAVLRDYDLYKQDYTDLLNRQLRSQLTTNLEQQQEGQHFRLIDPPTLPDRPSSPKRRKIGLIGAAAGVGLGIALAFLKSLKNSSFYTENEVREQFSVALVVGLPMLLTRKEIAANTRKQRLEWVAATMMLMVVAGAEIYIFRKG